LAFFEVFLCSWSVFGASFGCSDCGAASLALSSLSPLLELELDPVDDFPQSHESDFELLLLSPMSSSSLSSHPELEELDELDELELELDELEELDVLLLPQLSPLSPLLVVVSVVSDPVDDVLPQLSSATGASSPVSS
jgi:hypothetical protein